MLLDINDPQRMGLLSLGLRLMSTPGKFGPALGAAGHGAIGDMMRVQDRVDRGNDQKLRQQLLMMQVEQAKALQEAQKAQAARQAKDEGLMRQMTMGAPMDGMGPPSFQPQLDPATFMANGGSMQGLPAMLQLQAALAPKKEKPLVLNPGATVFDPATNESIFTNPFKPEPQKLPAFAQLQEYRDTLPPGDPRRIEVDALIRNQTRPPASATRPAPQVTPEQAPSDRFAMASQLGVPVAERDPFAGMSGTQADIFKRSLYQKADQKLNDADEAAAKARATAQDMRRFLELQQQVGMQGPVMGRVLALSSEAQEMDAITDKITPQMRAPGSGATSDFDAKMFRNSTVSRTKNDTANEAIAQAVILNSQNTADRAQFMRDYLTVNGHLDGADRQWSNYLRNNPIFDPKSPNEPKLNPSRMPYQQFFGGAQSPATDSAQRTVRRTGTHNGRKVVEYSDGSIEYAD